MQPTTDAYGRLTHDRGLRLKTRAAGMRPRLAPGHRKRSITGANIPNRVRRAAESAKSRRWLASEHAVKGGCPLSSSVNDLHARPVPGTPPPPHALLSQVQTRSLAIQDGGTGYGVSESREYTARRRS